MFSNSWRESSDSLRTYYTSTAASIDRFMWTYPEALVIYAAGNEGGSNGATVSVAKTVSPPSTNKNGICVGASLSDHKSWLAYSAGDFTFVTSHYLEFYLVKI